MGHSIKIDAKSLEYPKNIYCKTDWSVLNNDDNTKDENNTEIVGVVLLSCNSKSKCS